MSFSKDVKKYLYDASENLRDCCKNSFRLGASGEKPVLVCNKCANQYAAGAFCSYGTMSEPQKRFQLFIYPTNEAEEHLFSILSERMSPNFGTSKGKKSIYFKSGESVGEFLAFCKATPFAMKIYQTSIEKEEKSRVQRECNAEIANMVRAATAAAEQLEAIRLLKKYNMLDNLKKELKDAAILRETYPEAGLSELVSLATDTVSKSGLNYRLKKLVSLADDLKTEDEA